MAPACLKTDHTPLLAEQYDLWSLPQFLKKDMYSLNYCFPFFYITVNLKIVRVNSHFANTLCYDKLMLCMFLYGLHNHEFYNKFAENYSLPKYITCA